MSLILIHLNPEQQASQEDTRSVYRFLHPHTLQCIVIGDEHSQLIHHDYSTAHGYDVCLPFTTVACTVYCPESGRLVC